MRSGSKPRVTRVYVAECGNAISKPTAAEKITSSSSRSASKSRKYHRKCNHFDAARGQCLPGRIAGVANGVTLAIVSRARRNRHIRSAGDHRLP